MGGTSDDDGYGYEGCYDGVYMCSMVICMIVIIYIEKTYFQIDVVFINEIMNYQLLIKLNKDGK